jgi:hypothetical protein
MPISFSQPAKPHTAFEAVHFYMCCVIGITILSLLTASMFSALTQSAFVSIGAMRLVNSVIIIYIGAHISRAKKLPLPMTLVALSLAGMLSFYVNELLGLVVIALLTMMQPKS